MAETEQRSLIDRLKSSTLARVISAYGESQAGNYAAGLAFNALMTMFPLILGILAIIGLAINDPHVHDQVEAALLGVFPGDAQPSIHAALSGVRDSAGLLGIVSILGLLWTGTNFFAALEFALDKVYGVNQRDFLRQRLMGVIMIIALVVAVVASIGANSLIDLLPGATVVLGPVIAALLMIGLVLVIYRVVPNRTFRLREIWQGAVVAGLLIEIISLAFPLYGKLVRGFNTYGAQFALFFLLATWLAFLSQFILLGAVWNRVQTGDPDATGVVSSPQREARETPEPIEAIKRETAPEPSSRTAGTTQRRAPLVGLLVALAGFALVALNRRRRTAR
jgi:membrane protein